MTVKPLDFDQKLDRPRSQAIGFVDTEEQLHAVVEALHGIGYDNSKITVMHGDGGIAQVRRLQEIFYFGDGEDAMLQFAISELGKNHYALGIEVDHRENALQIAQLVEPLGAHSFSYFGTWKNERLTR